MARNRTGAWAVIHHWNGWIRGLEIEQRFPFKEQPAWIANVGVDYSNESLVTSVSVISNFLARRYDYKPTGDVTGKAGSFSFDVAVYQRLRGRWRFFVEMNNLTNRNRIEDEMFVNGTTNRRSETYGRTLLSGIQFGF